MGLPENHRPPQDVAKLLSAIAHFRVIMSYSFKIFLWVCGVLLHPAASCGFQADCLSNPSKPLHLKVYGVRGNREFDTVRNFRRVVIQTCQVSHFQDPSRIRGKCHTASCCLLPTCSVLAKSVTVSVTV